MTGKADLFPTVQAGDRERAALSGLLRILLPLPPFFLCYLEQKSVDDIIPFPEQIQPHCIIPSMCMATSTPIKLCSATYTRHENTPNSKAPPPLLQKLLGWTRGPAPEHTKCIKLLLHHEHLLQGDTGDRWQFTVFFFLEYAM